MMRFEEMLKIYKTYFKSSQLAQNNSKRQIVPDNESIWSEKSIPMSMKSSAKNPQFLSHRLKNDGRIVHRSADFGDNSVAKSSAFKNKSPFSKIDPLVDISSESSDINANSYNYKISKNNNETLQDTTFEPRQPESIIGDNYDTHIEGDTAKDYIGSVLHKYHHIKTIKNQIKKSIKDEEELLECTFHPQLNPNSEKIVEMANHRPVV
jgi:hypothetical protein